MATKAATSGKRCLLWDWTNTRDRPDAINQLFSSSSPSPFVSVANWNAWVPPELAGRLPFRPTVRTMEQVTGEEWAWIRDSAHDTVLFFNEPERQQGLTPAKAARAWREHALPELRHGSNGAKRLVGPGVASDDAGRDWQRAFMGQLDRQKGEWPDVLGVHYYGSDWREAAAYLESMHAEFGGLPLFVSEVACIDRDPARVEAFTAGLAAWMDATPWVLEYAFFGCMNHLADDFVSPAAQLMDANGGFTPLMRMLTGEREMPAQPK